MVRLFAGTVFSNGCATWTEVESMLNVGVCEDQEPIRKVLVRGLTQAGHQVLAARTGREALAAFAPDRGFDVIIMDIGLPDADGRDVVQALKAEGQLAPVLFLTALGGTHEVLAGFAAGADDYVVKPFEIKEVLVRLEALARRHPAPRMTLTGMSLDPAAHSLRHGDAEVSLSPTEFRMLAAIMGRPGEVVRRLHVVAAAWPDGAHVTENTVDSFIRRIRSKLDEIDSPLVLETVRGVGFTMTERSEVDT